MSQELVKVEQQIQQGGVGFDFDSKLFTLKPSTLSVNQINTQADGATPGKLRIHESGEQFERMTVVLLTKPVEFRQYHIGEPGQLKRIPANLVCSAKEPVKGSPWVPDERSKIIQSPFCSTCPKNNSVNENWAVYNKSQDPKDIPACDSQYYTVLLDATTQLPMKMYIGYTHREAFKAGMGELAKKARLLQSRGLNPNLFDFSFDIYVSKVKTKKNTISYILTVDPKSIRYMNDEEREKFGGLYLAYVNRGQNEPNEELVQIAKTESDIDDAVSNTIDATINENGEVVI